eukprot:Nk52_evm83s352 gene=Nk52_evmTU83s352
MEEGSGVEHTSVKEESEVEGESKVTRTILKNENESAEVSKEFSNIKLRNQIVSGEGEEGTEKKNEKEVPENESEGSQDLNEKAVLAHQPSAGKVVWDQQELMQNRNEETSQNHKMNVLKRQITNVLMTELNQNMAAGSNGNVVKNSTNLMMTDHDQDDGIMRRVQEEEEEEEGKKWEQNRVDEGIGDRKVKEDVDEYLLDNVSIDLSLGSKDNEKKGEEQNERERKQGSIKLLPYFRLFTFAAGQDYFLLGLGVLFCFIRSLIPIAFAITFADLMDYYDLYQKVTGDSEHDDDDDARGGLAWKLVARSSDDEQLAEATKAMWRAKFSEEINETCATIAFLAVVAFIAACGARFCFRWSASRQTAVLRKKYFYAITATSTSSNISQNSEGESMKNSFANNSKSKDTIPTKSLLDSFESGQLVAVITTSEVNGEEPPLASRKGNWDGAAKDNDQDRMGASGKVNVHIGRRFVKQTSNTMSPQIPKSTPKGMDLSIGDVGVDHEEQSHEAVNFTHIDSNTLTTAEDTSAPSELEEDGFFDEVINGEDSDVAGQILAHCRLFSSCIDDSLGSCISSLFTLLTAILWGLTIHGGWQQALVMSSILPFVIWGLSALANRMGTVSEQENEVMSHAGLFAEKVFCSIATVIAFSGKSTAVHTYRELLTDCDKGSMSFGKHKGVLFGVMEGGLILAIYTTFAAGFLFGAWKISRDEVTSGEVISLFIAFAIALNISGRYVTAYLSRIGPSLAILRVVFGFIDAKCKIAAQEEEVIGGRKQYSELEPVEPSESKRMEGSATSISPSRKSSIWSTGSTRGSSESLFSAIKRKFSGKTPLKLPSTNSLDLAKKEIEDHAQHISCKRHRKSQVGPIPKQYNKPQESEPGVERGLVRGPSNPQDDILRKWSTKESQQRRDSIRGDISFNNVTFAYPSFISSMSKQSICSKRSSSTTDAAGKVVFVQDPVLNDFSLTIKQGETVAIVGESGCGKSTIVSLLQKLHEPVFGSISISTDAKVCGEDNNSTVAVPLDNIPSEALHRCIGHVCQEPVLFNMTIRENVRLGFLQATDEQIEEALVRSGAMQFVQTLPNGMDFDVGLFGSRLSGGQRQRIVISRAIVGHPSILLLDEATSALDAASEMLVQESIEKIRREDDEPPTIVIVAHRLNTVKTADRICVLGRGAAILEMGSHDTLMEKRGRYFEMQANKDFIKDVQSEVCGSGTAEEHQFSPSVGSGGDTETRMHFKKAVNKQIQTKKKVEHKRQAFTARHKNKGEKPTANGGDSGKFVPRENQKPLASFHTIVQTLTNTESGQKKRGRGWSGGSTHSSASSNSLASSKGSSFLSNNSAVSRRYRHAIAMSSFSSGMSWANTSNSSLTSSGVFNSSKRMRTINHSFPDGAKSGEASNTFGESFSQYGWANTDWINDLFDSFTLQSSQQSAKATAFQRAIARVRSTLNEEKEKSGEGLRPQDGLNEGKLQALMTDASGGDAIGANKSSSQSSSHSGVLQWVEDVQNRVQKTGKALISSMSSLVDNNNSTAPFANDDTKNSKGPITTLSAAEVQGSTSHKSKLHRRKSSLLSLKNVDKDQSEAASDTSWSPPRPKLHRKISSLSMAGTLLATVHQGPEVDGDIALNSLLELNRSTVKALQQTYVYAREFAREQQKEQIALINHSSQNETSIQLQQEIDTSNYMRYSIATVCATLIGSSGATMAYLIANSVEVLTSHPKSEVLDSMTWYGIAFFMCGALYMAFNVVRSRMIFAAEELLGLLLRLRLFRAIINHPIAYFTDDTHSPAVLSSILTSEVAAINGLFGNTLAVVVTSICSLIFGLGLAFLTNPLLTLIVMLSIPMITLSVLANIKLSARYAEPIRVHLEDGADIISETVFNISTVKILQRQDYFNEKYAQTVDSWLEVERKRSIAYACLSSLAGLFVLLSFSLSFWYGGTLLKEDEIVFHDILLIFASVQLASQMVTGMVEMIPDFSRAQMAATTINALLASDITIQDCERKRTLKSDPNVQRNAKFLADVEVAQKGESGTIGSCEYDKNPVSNMNTMDMAKRKAATAIEFKNVYFRYPKPEPTDTENSSTDEENVTQEWILEDISFTIKRGSVVAIVGTSGSGKSTIISLLERFYEPTQGNIYVNGENITSLPENALRDQFGYVGQMPQLVGDKLRDCILYGDKYKVKEERNKLCRFSDDSIVSITNRTRQELYDQDSHRVRDLLNQCGMLEFVETLLPDGIESSVKGGKLSGGQKQRIAIARALIRDPNFLLLDEATSALDSINEALIYSILQKYALTRMSTRVNEPGDASLAKQDNIAIDIPNETSSSPSNNCRDSTASNKNTSPGDIDPQLTMIVVSHKLHTIKSADLILVLNKGHLVEQGSHQELMALGEGGHYHQMWKTQYM